MPKTDKVLNPFEGGCIKYPVKVSKLVWKRKFRTELIVTDSKYRFHLEVCRENGISFVKCYNEKMESTGIIGSPYFQCGEFICLTIIKE